MEPLIFSLTFEVVVQSGNPEGDPAELVLDINPSGYKSLLPRQTFTMQLPARGFPDVAAREEWASKTATAFRKRVPGALVHEMYLLFMDTANFYGVDLGYDTAPVGRNELVKIHLGATEQRVRAYMKAKGQRSKWTAAGLERAVRHAL